MGYSEKFNPEKYEPLQKVISAVQALEPGQSTVMTVGSAEDLSKARMLLYEVLHHLGVKTRFRIKVLGPTQLLILRLGFRSEPSTQTFGIGKDKEIEELIEVWGEPQAEALLQGWVTSGRVTKEEGVELWEHLKRIMS